MPQKLAVIPKNIQSHLQTKSDLHTEGSCLMRLLGLGKSHILAKNRIRQIDSSNEINSTSEYNRWSTP